jgi:hypothetical protein
MEEIRLAEVKDIVCQPARADPTGELETSYITLSTESVPARLGRVDSSKERTTPQYALYFDIAPTNPMEVIGITSQVWTAETGYAGLSDPRLANGIQCLDVMVAHIARGVSGIKLRYEGFPDTPRKNVRFCMIIARQADQEERWVRGGLVVISEYNSDTVETTQKDDAERKKLFEEMTQRNREIQDITIW